MSSAVRFAYQTVGQVEVGGQIVLLRTDYNVPLKQGVITDDSRIEVSIETINYLLDEGAKKVVIVSHLGRPEGIDPDLSLAPVAERLGELLDDSVPLVDLADFDRRATDKVVLLENIRFYAEEEAMNRGFVEEMVAKTGADLFVEDGFAVCHRATATTVTVCKVLPAYASLRLADEYQRVANFVPTAKRPLLGLLGGAKISDKIGFVEKLIDQADQVVVGGAMAQSFLAAKGLEVGQSLFSTEDVAAAAKILKLAKKLSTEIILPVDTVVADGTEATQSQIKLVTQVTPEDAIFDIGPETQKLVTDAITHARSVLWNGTFGYTENPLFQAGSRAVIDALDRNQPATLIGGGDTVGFIEQLRPNWRFDGLFLSTGGGAMLDLITNGELAGIKCLRQK